ncbi:unnamed protein product [Cuscuta epithymum]|uniref:RCK N-terminal domain-containing protein n=1 Tax=Cuscuta epithymum TaxID=186058 RepID=A0AAV0DC45_9ASTE|nr:unnamed protein product [Cuscuta epithymum]
MGFTYCLFQPCTAHYRDAVNFRSLHQPNICKDSKRISLGRSRFLCKSLSKKSSKRTTAARDQSVLSSRFLFDWHLCNSTSGGINVCSKAYRGVHISRCQGNDSTSFINRLVGDSDPIESGCDADPICETDSIAEIGSLSGEHKEHREEAETNTPDLDDLRELFHKALKDLEGAHINRTMFEEKAQTISEESILLKENAVKARKDVNNVLNTIQKIVNEETVAKEAVQKATMALSLAEARLQVTEDSLDVSNETNLPAETSGVSKMEASASLREDNELLLTANEIYFRECQDCMDNCTAELRQLQNRKEELQKEVERLNEVAEEAELKALKAEEDVGNVMLLAEQAVAFELEATQRASEAEVALQSAEKTLAISNVDSTEATNEHEHVEGVAFHENANKGNPTDAETPEEVPTEDDSVTAEPLPSKQINTTVLKTDEAQLLHKSEKEDSGLGSDRSKNVQSNKKLEAQKETVRDSSPLNGPKSLLKKSSRFFSASFFSFSADGVKFTPASAFHGLLESTRKELPKLIVGSLLLGAGFSLYVNRAEQIIKLFQQPDIITTSIDEVSTNTKPLVRKIKKLPQKIKKLINKLPQQEINEEEASLLDVIWLLLASVVFVPLFQKIPGGSPVLGYLAAGILIGPHGISIIRNVHATKAIAEFGVVFLLFNIGLELSVERLSSMKKYVFGLGTAQVLVTAAAVGLVTHVIAAQPGPAAIVIGNGLALSSTAVVLQVLQERGESTSRHGRATFSVLLFQDLAVVVLLILIPLISPNSSKGGVGFQAIAEALGLAGVKAIIAITAIIAGGRLLLRPIYKQISENQNAEIFSANTLLVILGTSLLTARAGLSMALGAFLAGLLLAETEFSLQVESDIAPYRGLLLGLFFMTVGMSIDPKLLVSNFPAIMGSIGLLIGGKTMLVALIGRFFGISIVSAIRVGLLLAPGGEFAFVAFGEAVNQGIMSPQLSSLLFLVVGISMAITPWLAAGGQLIASRFELQDVRSLLPVEAETDDLQDHIIICGYGRVGQIIAQLLSERLIPFVALDVRSDRVSIGRALDLPIYFGDSGSREVLHKVGAERACAAAITLDSPGANYRTVWALNKYYPNVKTFVRAHDVDHGLNLEKAGATAVVPESLEPSLQLAAAVLAQAKLPMSEIATTINEFRSRHLSELTELCQTTGSSLGYGFSRVVNKAKSQPSDFSDEAEGTLAI